MQFRESTLKVYFKVISIIWMYYPYKWKKLSILWFVYSFDSDDDDGKILMYRMMEARFPFLQHICNFRQHSTELHSPIDYFSDIPFCSMETHKSDFLGYSLHKYFEFNNYNWIEKSGLCLTRDQSYPSLRSLIAKGEI